MYTMVRVLPMDQEGEFDGLTIKDVQKHFFSNELPKREGKYRYKIQGLIADKMTTLVLFQYDNHIIACADLDKVVKFEKIEEDVYRGAFYFKPSSIKVLAPMTNADINHIFKCTKKFGQVKHSLNPSYASVFMKRLTLLAKSRNLGVRAKF